MSRNHIFNLQNLNIFLIPDLLSHEEVSSLVELINQKSQAKTPLHNLTSPLLSILDSRLRVELEINNSQEISFQANVAYGITKINHPDHKADEFKQGISTAWNVIVFLTDGDQAGLIDLLNLGKTIIPSIGTTIVWEGSSDETIKATGPNIQFKNTGNGNVYMLSKSYYSSTLQSDPSINKHESLDNQIPLELYSKVLSHYNQFKIELDKTGKCTLSASLNSTVLDYLNSQYSLDLTKSNTYSAYYSISGDDVIYNNSISHFQYDSIIIIGIDHQLDNASLELTNEIDQNPYQVIQLRKGQITILDKKQLRNLKAIKSVNKSKLSVIIIHKPKHDDA